MQRQVHPVSPNSGKVWKVFDLIWRISVQYQYIISISTGSHVEWYFRPGVLRRRRGESIGNPLISDRCLLYWFPMVSCIRLARTIVSPAFGFFPRQEISGVRRRRQSRSRRCYRARGNRGRSAVQHSQSRGTLSNQGLGGHHDLYYLYHILIYNI